MMVSNSQSFLHVAWNLVMCSHDCCALLGKTIFVMIPGLSRADKMSNQARNVAFFCGVHHVIRNFLPWLVCSVCPHSYITGAGPNFGRWVFEISSSVQNFFNSSKYILVHNWVPITQIVHNLKIWAVRERERPAGPILELFGPSRKRGGLDVISSYIFLNTHVCIWLYILDFLVRIMGIQWIPLNTKWARLWIYRVYLFSISSWFGVAPASSGSRSVVA